MYTDNSGIYRIGLWYVLYNLLIPSKSFVEKREEEKKTGKPQCQKDQSKMINTTKYQSIIMYS